jgi:hypothetical protein
VTCVEEEDVTMKRVVRTVLVMSVVLLMMAAGHSAGQKQVKHSATFSCPDDKAAVACGSFAENKEDLGYNEFACFRQGADQYVKVSMGLQPLPWTWDPTTKTATQDSMIFAWVMDHGLENTRYTPDVGAIGTWRTNFMGGYDFAGAEGTEVTGGYGKSGVSLKQVYKNTQDKEVTYLLAISGDTLRFRETWHLPNNVVDEQFGRCVAGPAQWPDYATITKGPPSE